MDHGHDKKEEYSSNTIRTVPYSKIAAESRFKLCVTKCNIVPTYYSKAKVKLSS